MKKINVFRILSVIFILITLINLIYILSKKGEANILLLFIPSFLALITSILSFYVSYKRRIKNCY